MTRARKDDVVTFEQLGVDRLFVDESHIITRTCSFIHENAECGRHRTDRCTEKSSDMFMPSASIMDEITGGKGVTFATGTPVSNSMTELYTTIMRYLQYGTLHEAGTGTFRCVGGFFWGNTVTAIELVTGRERDTGQRHDLRRFSIFRS